MTGKLLGLRHPSAGANRLLGGSAFRHYELEGGFHDALASALWYNKLPRRAAADIRVPRVRPRYLLSLSSFSKMSRWHQPGLLSKDCFCPGSQSV